MHRTVITTILLTISNLALITGAAQCRLASKAPIPPAGLRFTISMSEPVARTGHPVTIHVTLSNESKTAFALRDNWQPDLDYELRLRDSQGKEAPFTESGRKLRTYPIRSSGNMIVLAPGDKVELHQDLSKIYAVSVPGDYTLEACRNVLDWGNIYSNKLVIPFTH